MRNLILIGLLCASTAAAVAQVNDGMLVGEYRYVLLRYSQLARRSAQPMAVAGVMQFDGAGGLTSNAVRGSYVTRTDGSVRWTTPVDGARMIQGGLSPELGILTGLSPASSAAFDWTVALAAPHSSFDADRYSGDYVGWAIVFSPFDLANSLVSVFKFSVGETTSAFQADGTGTIQFANTAGIASFVFDSFITQNGDFLAGSFSNQGISGIFYAARKSNLSPQGPAWTLELSLDHGRVSAGWGPARVGLDQVIFSQRWNGPRGSFDYRGASELALTEDVGLLGATPIAIASGTLIGGRIGSTSGSLFVAHPAPAAARGELLHIAADVDAASFVNAAASPGQLRSLFGSGFSNSEAAAAAFPLPTELAGASVRVNGELAPLLYVGPQQVNYQVPDSSSGVILDLVVQTPGGNSESWPTELKTSGPDIFSSDLSGTGLGVVTHADFTRVTPESPASPGEVVVVFLTGLGRGTQVPAVSVGSVAAEIYFAGRLDGFAGLDQINFRIPADAATNSVTPVTISDDNGWSDLVTIAVQR